MTKISISKFNFFKIVPACVLLFTSSLVLDAAPQKILSPKLKVVATYSIIGDWVREVAGDTVDLTVLVGPDGDVHTFEPTPADAIALAEADIIFENGLGLEFWLNKLYKASGAEARRVIVSDGVAFLRADGTDAVILTSKMNSCCSHTDCCSNEPKIEQPIAQMHEMSCCAEHTHCEYDPHFWLDVTRVIVAVISINETLAERDPGNEDLFNENAQKYLIALNNLDRWISEATESIPFERRVLVSNHNNLNYFAHRYNFQYLGNALNSMTTDAHEPSAKEFTDLLKSIEAFNVRALFGDNTQNPKLINQLAQEAHLPVPSPLYTGALGAKDSPGKSYIDMMQYNVNTIVSALSRSTNG